MTDREKESRKRLARADAHTELSKNAHAMLHRQRGMISMIEKTLFSNEERVVYYQQDLARAKAGSTAEKAFQNSLAEAYMLDEKYFELIKKWDKEIWAIWDKYCEKGIA